MSTTPISSLLSQPAAATATGPAPGGVLGRDEFLQLLTIQLQYQDPLNPISNQEFAAQLAQFSSLEQMEQMNETMQAELLLSESAHNAMATNMIGRHVRVVGNVFAMADGEDAPLPKLFAQASSPGQANVRITDAAGEVVRSFDVQLDSTDATEIAWDGKDASGDRLAAGLYRIEVVMQDEEAGAYPPVTLIEDEVKTIRFLNGVTELLLGSAPYTLADVLEIRA
jgi:flagellar basal-body rod modification protein FlgD